MIYAKSDFRIQWNGRNVQLNMFLQGDLRTQILKNVLITKLVSIAKGERFYFILGPNSKNILQANGEPTPGIIW